MDVGKPTGPQPYAKNSRQLGKVGVAEQRVLNSEKHTSWLSSAKRSALETYRQVTRCYLLGIYMHAIPEREAMNLEAIRDGYIEGFGGRIGKGEMLCYVILCYHNLKNKIQKILKEKKNRRMAVSQYLSRELSIFVFGCGVRALSSTRDQGSIGVGGRTPSEQEMVW